MPARSPFALLMAAVLTLASVIDAQQRVPDPLASFQSRDALSQRATVNGVAVEFSMRIAGAQPASSPAAQVYEPPPSSGDRADSLVPIRFREGDDVVFRFAIRDATSGAPLPGAKPAAWMDLRHTGQPDTNCRTRVQELLSGSIFRRAELDLNVFYVLAMNQDATITVVDPLFGFGQ